MQQTASPPLKASQITRWGFPADGNALPETSPAPHTLQISIVLVAVIVVLLVFIPSDYTSLGSSLHFRVLLGASRTSQYFQGYALGEVLGILPARAIRDSAAGVWSQKQPGSGDGGDQNAARHHSHVRPLQACAEGRWPWICPHCRERSSTKRARPPSRLLKKAVSATPEADKNVCPLGFPACRRPLSAAC